MKEKTRRIESEEAQEIPKKSSKKAEPKQEATMSKNDFLETVTSISIPKTDAPAKKNGITTLTPPEAKEGETDIREMVDAIVKWKKVEKEAKAECETKEAELIDWVKPQQEEDGFNNNYQKSYYIDGKKERVTYVSSDRFSVPKEEEIPVLKELLGDKFEQIIQSKIELKIRDEVFSNKALQKELMDLMPKNPDGTTNKEVFSKFFAAKTEWSVVEGFDVSRFKLGKKLFAKVMEILRQSKPSIK